MPDDWHWFVGVFTAVRTFAFDEWIRAHGYAMTDSANIQQAIDAYTPAWRPPVAALDGILVTIEPICGDWDTVQAHDTGELALMSAGVLFHMVQQAGGIPQMTRADKGVAPRPTQCGSRTIGSDPRDEGRASDNDPHIAIRISFDTAGRADDAYSSNNTNNITDQLATEIRSEFTRDPLANLKVDVRTLDSHVPTGDVAVVMGPGFESVAASREVPREIAARICRGINALAPTLRESAQGGSSTSILPTPIPRFIDRPAEVEMRSAARRVWPTGDLPLDRSAWFCDAFVRMNFSDRTFVYLEPRVTVEENRVRISGATNVALLRDTLVDALRAVGVDQVSNEMRVLPEDGAIGDERYGVCVSPMCLTYADTSEASGMQSQLLYGEPVRVLDREAGFVLVHGDDGYWGWVREANLKLLTEDAYKTYIEKPRAVLTRDVQRGDQRLTRGCVLPVIDQDSAKVTLTDPFDQSIEVRASDVYIPNATQSADDRATAALDLMHTPYVFGGVSPIGLDCSGLAQQVCRRTGTLLPRDAAKQFTNGRLVATRWDSSSIAKGDLLFFINTTGRIFHVGVALNATHFVHSGPPEVKIDSLHEGDRLYAPDRARTFLAARRLQ